MTDLTDAQVERLAKMAKLPPLPPGPAPDPAELERCMAVAREAFAATLRPAREHSSESGAVRVGAVVLLTVAAGLLLWALPFLAHHLATR